MKERHICALTHVVLGVSERHVVVMTPRSRGKDGPWELEEIARINGDTFDALAANLGYTGGRITGIESCGKSRPSVVRIFNFQTFVATEPPRNVKKLIAGLPFLAPYVRRARRCMTGGDEQRNFLRGTGSTRALWRPVSSYGSNAASAASSGLN
ncbi:MAG: hypothetical protein AAB666_02325 [Patescibacteria group bacterium]